MVTLAALIPSTQIHCCLQQRSAAQEPQWIPAIHRFHYSQQLVKYISAFLSLKILWTMRLNIKSAIGFPSGYINSLTHQHVSLMESYNDSLSWGGFNVSWQYRAVCYTQRTSYFQASSSTNQVCTGTEILSGSQMLLLCHSGGSLLHPGLNMLLDLEKEKKTYFFSSINEHINSPIWE